MKKVAVLTCLLLMYLSLSVSAQGNQVIRTNVTSAGMTDTFSGKLLIPNAFSPNGDGKNDVFRIANFSNERLLEFKVFNRWGTVLFATEDPLKGWNGTFKGKALPIGVYGYVIRIVYPEDVVETYKGTVTLIR